MSSFDTSSISPDADAVRRDAHEQAAQDGISRSDRLSPEQLARRAELVAAGELPLPVDLLPDQFERLVLEVRKRRRKRLVEHIARAIAMDIQRSRES